MVKLRAMGTEADLKRMKKIIERNDFLEILSASEILRNKDTNTYRRIYMDVEFTRPER